MQHPVRLVAIATLLFAAGAPAGEFRVQASVPYSDSAVVAGNIKRECAIDTQLPGAVKRFAAAAGHQVALAGGDGDGDGQDGQVLKMEIVDAFSSGNAWMGHRKSVAIRGWLFRDGVQVAAFVARRNSSGGFGAGFKGSCSVLERTVDAIGRDVARWLSNPVDGAQLGDLR